MIQKILNKPLLIDPQSLAGLKLDSLFLSVPEKDDSTIAASVVSNPKHKKFGTYDIYNDVAVIPIHGLLTKRTEAFDSFFGTTSYDEIHELLATALGDSKVSSILLDIDSPGGEVSGLFDLVDFIYESRNVKPIYAIANDHAFSAAYAIASAASKIFVNRTSGVGSIGVIATHVDISEYDKKEGIKYTTIFAGDKKNDLSPHEPLSDDAISDLQKEVDRLYKMFVAMVARNRNISTAQVKATQAATYFGGDAIGLGLADQLEAGHNILKRISGMVSDTVIMKGNVMAENVESQISEAETYRAEILEISQLCKLAHTENKLAEFIEQGLNVDQVKEKLLASVSTQNEIVSTVYHKEVAQENPVVAAAKARMINK